MGKVRRNNEDNFFFDNKCLELENSGLRNPVSMEEPLKSGLCLAVLDGMGGENFGEQASYAAVRKLQEIQRKKADFFVSEKKYLNQLVFQLNDAVVRAKKELRTEHMGTTFTALYFTAKTVYVCNVGDSRAYRMRAGEFLQLSEDHVSQYVQSEGRKPPLTQYLGIDPEEMLLEPHIAKGDLRKGDRYLLCSDGLTDMLTNLEIAAILMENEDPESCVRSLIQAALDRGGRDNITAIVCRLL